MNQAQRAGSYGRETDSVPVGGREGWLLFSPYSCGKVKMPMLAPSPAPHGSLWRLLHVHLVQVSGDACLEPSSRYRKEGMLLAMLCEHWLMVLLL